jgi:hypothetical protein
MTYTSAKADMPINAPERTSQGFLFALKAQFGGTFMTIPFADAKFPEVCARVAYAWVKLTYKRCKSPELSGTQCVNIALETLPRDMRGAIEPPLLGLQFHLIRRGDSRTWLSTAVQHSRAGLGFRRCYFDDYKAPRRNPRVTNRGVRVRQERLPLEG